MKSDAGVTDRHVQQAFKRVEVACVYFFLTIRSTIATFEEVIYIRLRLVAQCFVDLRKGAI